MKPWLLLNPQAAHDLAPWGLSLIAAFRDVSVPEWQAFHWRGLEFKNRLGIAGGVDKDGASIEDWWRLGPGFIEIGTVTPLPQGPNPGRIIDRDVERMALWNKMGFPGSGAEAVRRNLDDLPSQRPTPIFVNIGKNRATANEHAADDYSKCIQVIGDQADAWVVNISSPNTAGLRDLFKPQVFKPFLERILTSRDLWTSRRAPIMLKLSPDLTDEDLTMVIASALDIGVDGLIATNTTLTREPGMRFSSEGGVSGRPLARASKRTLMRVCELSSGARSRPLIISVGGVLSVDDVKERLDLGADLVQVYSALVFHGPFFFSRVAQAFAASNEKTSRV